MTTDLVTWLREQIKADVEQWRPVLSSPRRNGKATARVELARCEAYTAILREHRPYGEWLRDELPDWAPSAERSCVGCGFDNQEERRTPDVNECPTLRALALAYRHRDGYREEWRWQAP